MGIVCSCGNRSLEGSQTKKETGEVEEQVKVKEQVKGQESATQISEKPSVPRSRQISQVGPYGTIQLSLPDGWGYELCPMDSGKLSYGAYGIRFYPDKEEGAVEVTYIDPFGVCGTGLEEESVTLAGQPASIGTYDGKEYWDFIVFNGKLKGLVAQTINVKDGWERYGTQVLGILDTVSFDTDVKEGGAYIADKDSYADEIGLYFSLKNITPTGADLVFQQYDKMAPQGELSFGQYYMIERKEGSEWKEVPVVLDGEYAFEEIAYLIEKNKETVQEVNWEWLYGKLEPGEYRIRKQVDDFVETGMGNKSYTLYARFFLN